MSQSSHPNRSNNPVGWHGHCNDTWSSPISPSRRFVMRKVFPFLLSGFLAVSFSQIAAAQSTYSQGSASGGASADVSKPADANVSGSASTKAGAGASTSDKAKSTDSGSTSAAGGSSTGSSTGPGGAAAGATTDTQGSAQVNKK